MNPKDKAAELRWRAEDLARKKLSSLEEQLEVPSPEATLRTLHELRVHQIELEMQNDELRQVQAKLDSARARYFDLYDLAPLGYCIFSDEGLILEANQAAVNLLGLPRAALIKQPITRFIAPEDQDLYYIQRRRFLRTGEPFGLDLRMRTADGTTFWANMTGTSAQAPAGDIIGGGARVVMADITGRKRIEQALERSETLLRTTQQLTRVGSWAWEAELDTLFWTEELYRLYDLKSGSPSPSEAQVARSLECYAPEDRAALEDALRQCREQGKPFDLEFRITTVKGRSTWVRSFASATVEDGRVVRVIGYLLDILDRRREDRTRKGLKTRQRDGEAKG
jgi:PAS domain S-box-containing protein